ncbi:hypothetical protein QQZ08_008679 [Neonectria magnoliae]|uniref:AB hydrolase-1 domain-containing protein n=1 Tax=Neonectria magnoliae TaxID=2732573 RepID=A0ABR1HT24_9HYPO
MDASPELFVTLPAGVRICYQTFGSPSNPAVILIAGDSSSMLSWLDNMLSLFSPAGDEHYLIRFDHRDTGLSTEFPVPAGYTLGDMATDIEGLIDHLDLASKGVHLVAASKGGPLGYTVATRRPQQVRSLTLMYTSPGITEETPLAEGFQNLNVGGQPFVGGSGNERAMFIAYQKRLVDAYATQPLGEEESKEMDAMAERVTDRDMRGGTLFSKGPNHGAASVGCWPGKETLNRVKCPTTVIQAALDPIFGPIHGETLAREIEGAEYVLWEDVGHEVPKRIWSRLADQLLRT